MASNMKGGGGGGYGSRPHVEKPVKTGVGNRGVSVGRIGQLGQLQGSHTTDGRETSYRGEGKTYQGAALRPALMGNEIAASTKCGVGGSRTIYKTGSQGQQGQVPGTPRPAGRDILNEFGPNKRSY